MKGHLKFSMMIKSKFKVSTEEFYTKVPICRLSCLDGKSIGINVTTQHFFDLIQLRETTEFLILLFLDFWK